MRLMLIKKMIFNSYKLSWRHPWVMISIPHCHKWVLPCGHGLSLALCELSRSWSITRDVCTGTLPITQHLPSTQHRSHTAGEGTVACWGNPASGMFHPASYFTSHSEVMIPMGPGRTPHWYTWEWGTHLGCNTVDQECYINIIDWHTLVMYARVNLKPWCKLFMKFNQRSGLPHSSSCHSVLWTNSSLWTQLR